MLPGGPYEGERYRHHRHPVSRLWFNALDSGRWSRYAATGPTQNGKTLMCYVAPILYHLFEIGETVIVGLPTMDMAKDKWEQDFKPVIQASEYRDLLPTSGEGSRGGDIKRSITFRNGATLRFMTAGGNDKKRAGYTSRVLGVTETDGMDESGDSSREADKIEQLEGRTRAFGRTGKRVYLECTVSIERGRIWQEVKNGTDSKIVRRCPHCGEWVAPEREHLVGWEKAQSEEEAAELSHFICPDCLAPWSEQDRTSAAETVKLVHRGQEITSDGVIVGEPIKTQTLGFRWSAIDNPFETAGNLGAEEWKAKKSADRENAEKKMRQFIWCLPYEPPDVDLTPLSADQIQEKRTDSQRGVVPDGCIGIAVGVDTGKRVLHWDAKAIMPDGSKLVIDYGKQRVDADRLGVFQGLLESFRALRAKFEAGWNGRRPEQVWIDSGYHEHTRAIYALCEESNNGLKLWQQRYRPTRGYGEGQRNLGRYIAPTSKAQDIVFVGREYDIRRARSNGKIIHGVLVVNVNADHWKSELHQGLLIPRGEPGSISLFASSDTFEHSEYTAHLLAEKQVEKFVPARGNVIVWERVDRQNHFLDAGYLATVAGEFMLAMRKGAVESRKVVSIPQHMRRA